MGKGQITDFQRRLQELWTAKERETGRTYSNREVAEALGVSHSYVNNLRKGQALPPRLDVAQAIATFFGADPDYFTRGSDSQDGHEADLQTELRTALNDPDIQKVALYLAEGQRLSTEGIQAILDMINHLRKVDSAARDARGSTRGTGP